MSDRPVTTLSTILISVLSAFAVCIILLLSLSNNKGEALFYFFVYPFFSTYHTGNMLDSSAILMLSGLGAAIAFRSGVFNLGGEGQVYLGALIAAQLALILNGLTPILAVPLILITSSVASGMVGGASGLLRTRWNIDELITTFLISSAMVPIIDYAISEPLRDATGYLLSTPPIPKEYAFLRLLKPSRLSISIFLAVPICLAAQYGVTKTVWGFEQRTSGLNRRFARYCAIPVGTYVVVPMALSSFLHGLAGSFTVLSTYHSAVQGSTSGIGWNGIAVALIAENNPALVIPAALFFAFLDTATETAMLNTQFSFELSFVIRAVVFLFITARGLQLRFLNGRPPGQKKSETVG